MSKTVWGKLSPEERAKRNAYKKQWHRDQYQNNEEYRAKILAQNSRNRYARLGRQAREKAKSVTDADLDAMAAATLEGMRNARRVEPICVRSATALAG